MRTLGVVTAGRSDFGIYRPLLRLAQADPRVNVRLIVTGMHLVPEHGYTAGEIETEGFEIAEKVEMLLSSDTPAAVSTAMGVALIAFAQVYARGAPDLLVVLGDRFEMYAAALAALPWGIPIAHIHGGELTAGAFDDALRHSLTKLAHLHFVATEDYARRLRQMGEESWRIVVSGAPGLDNLREVMLLSRNEIEARYHLRLDPPPLLVTYHPVTLELDDAERQVKELLAALDEFQRPTIVTQPNADPGGRRIRQWFEEFARERPWVRLVDNLGTQGYFSIMASAGAMVGNSSSGLIEASSFALPTVNIGSRQEGRVRARNVIDVGYHRAEIVAGIRRALDPSFRQSLAGMSNPYGQGSAAPVIVDHLATVDLTRLLRKQFVDWPVDEAVWEPLAPA